MKEKEKLIEDDIVKMLDAFMAAGGGHMNIEVDAAKEGATKQIEQTKSYECNGKIMACQSPTLYEGLDTQE